MDWFSSFESVSSDIEYGSASSAPLVSESRHPSVESLNVNRPLSPESPIPEYRQFLLDSYSSTLERSLSPASFSSDIEYGSVSLSVGSEMRPSSPYSVLSGENDTCDSSITEFRSGLAESVPVAAH